MWNKMEITYPRSCCCAVYSLIFYLLLMWLTTFGKVCKLKQQQQKQCSYALYAFCVDALKVDRFIVKYMTKRQKPF